LRRSRATVAAKLTCYLDHHAAVSVLLILGSWSHRLVARLQRKIATLTVLINESSAPQTMVVEADFQP
jgi:hypothetical protein